jgi:hypothetical protein
MGSSSEYQAVVPVRVDPGFQGVDFGFSAIDVIGLGPLQVTVLEDVTKVSPDDRPVLRGQIVCLQEQLREPEVVIFASKFCIFLTPQDQSLLE